MHWWLPGCRFFPLLLGDAIERTSAYSSITERVDRFRSAATDALALALHNTRSYLNFLKTGTLVLRYA
ncbi:MAG TPA: hypothetical protein VM715_08770 [Candidatus Acidoferrum sp.]|jgi:hypothetical protein|nr:hypothetical protein [Candidatus Acidoferrum sp.]